MTYITKDGKEKNVCKITSYRLNKMLEEQGWYFLGTGCRETAQQLYDRFATKYGCKEIRIYSRKFDQIAIGK